jgi:hypothetical protein
VLAPNEMMAASRSGVALSTEKVLRKGLVSTGHGTVHETQYPRKMDDRQLRVKGIEVCCRVSADSWGAKEITNVRTTNESVDGEEGFWHTEAVHVKTRHGI